MPESKTPMGRDSLMQRQNSPLSAPAASSVREAFVSLSPSKGEGRVMVDY